MRQILLSSRNLHEEKMGYSRDSTGVVEIDFRMKQTPPVVVFIMSWAQRCDRDGGVAITTGLGPAPREN